MCIKTGTVQTQLCMNYVTFFADLHNTGLDDVQ